MDDGPIRPVPECFSFGKFHPVYAVHSVNNFRQILWPNDLYEFNPVCSWGSVFTEAPPPLNDCLLHIPMRLRLCPSGIKPVFQMVFLDPWSNNFILPGNFKKFEIVFVHSGPY